MSSSMKKAMEKAKEKMAEQVKRKKEKQEAKSAEERRRQKEKRAQMGLPEPKCSSCGQEGHLKSSSKQCLNYKPRNSVKMTAVGLTRKATIKSSLRRGCPNEILAQTIQQVVLKTRNLGHVGSLFANFAVIQRLQSGQPIPPLDHSFFYQIFAQLVGIGRGAAQWIKDSYQEFRPLMPSTLASNFYPDSDMVTKIALQYHTDFANHIVHDFARFSKNYFFLRLNNEADTWYEANASVRERKSLAEYIYKRAASLEAAWPEVESSEILRSTYDDRAASLELGPTPITEASLFASPHSFLPFLHVVLEYMDNQVHVLEPAPQNFVSKGYIFRKLNEVSKVCDSRIMLDM
jgi:hypothetical protein